MPFNPFDKSSASKIDTAKSEEDAVVKDSLDIVSNSDVKIQKKLLKNKSPYKREFQGNVEM